MFLYSELQNNNKHLTFALCFFMVLDLRLMKIGCRETTFPFLNPFVFLYSFVDI